MVGACSALAMTHHFLGDFEAGRRHAIHGIQIWRSGSVQSHADDLDVRAATCLCYEAFSAWNFGEIAESQRNMVEAISLVRFGVIDVPCTGFFCDIVGFVSEMALVQAEDVLAYDHFFFSSTLFLPLN
jgi:hypothetical protein